MSKDYAHLHVHTETSFLDGLPAPEEYAKLAAAMKQPALANTDHGNLCQAPTHYKVCKKHGVEPILGFEGYFVNDVATAKEEKDAERSHITVLARGAKGYNVLAEFNTATWKQFYYKPLIDRALCEQLGKDAKRLTVLSGCAGSQLSRLLLADEDELAAEELIWWRDTFPHYYIEIMHHGTDFDLKLNKKLLKLAKRYSIPWVVTNDPHYAIEEDAPVQDALLAIQMAKDLDDPKRMRFDGSGYWLKSYSEMRRTFDKAGYAAEVFRQGAATAVQIAKDSITNIPKWDSKTWQIPAFPGSVDPDKDLKVMAKAGLRRKGVLDDPLYSGPLKDELRTIKDTGIASFLLITQDIDAYAESIGIRVGPGRGSVAGSVTCYGAGIHKCDPIRYGLRFDRFLNPARPKMPDIDTDFQASRRPEVFSYAIQKYGVENTMMVAAYGSFRVKAAFNSLAKAYGIDFNEAHRLNKEIVEAREDDGHDTYVLSPELTEKYPELTRLLNRLAGTKRSISAHPAGLIIADPSAELRKQVPEMWIASSKRWVAAYDKKALEAQGWMKQDFLGLRCLDTIAECIKLLKERQGIDIEPDGWVPDEEPYDKEIYKMIAKGQTSGIFQMEGPVNQRGCRDVKPKCFEDIYNITSLYRTGPISAGYPAQFISNRIKGADKIQYLHPLLKSILEPTWGVILFQEQVMTIGEVLAGFDGAGVDEIKEAIKDKSSDEMDRMRPLFVKGCKKTHNIKESVATEIWDIIEGYAGYGYNKSHAVAYSLITYQTARLKYLYPIEYYTALLRTIPNTKDNFEKRQQYLKDAINEGGAIILPPDINESDALAYPRLDEDAIRFGLADLKGIGVKVAEKLLQGRKAAGKDGYTSYEQVVEAANNVGTIRILTEGSALEPLGVMGDVEATEAALGWTFRDQMVKWRKKFKREVQFPERDGDKVDVVGMIMSINKRNTKNGKPFVTWKIQWSITEEFSIRMWSECSSLWDLEVGSVVRCAGEWQQQWQNITVSSPKDVRVLEAVRLTRTSA